MMIEAVLAIGLSLVGAFAFGYYTGRDRGRADGWLDCYRNLNKPMTAGRQGGVSSLPGYGTDGNTPPL